MTRVSRWLVTSPERIETVLNDITKGSEPGGAFYALLITASMIASFGLVANSTAVIIGAMLVSPLMTPIFGVAVGMLQGNTRLFWQALSVEILGATFAVASAFLFGLLPIITDATPEMLVRTQPNLIDLMVAVFAGFAGAYALLDERVSPALPGVAIATAIVPPLSTAGLCFALGAYRGGAGALLLFLANFVAILIVALITFAIAGLAPTMHFSSAKQFLRRYGVTAVAFIAIVVILTHSMVRIVHDRFVKDRVETVLRSEFAKMNASELDRFEHRERDKTVHVMAIARSPELITPSEVKRMEAALADNLNMPVELMVRNMVAKDISATGAFTAENAPLSGTFFGDAVTPEERRKRLAEQVLLENLENEPGLRLTDVTLGRYDDRTLVAASVYSIRKILPHEVGLLQAQLRERMDDDSLAFVIRSVESQLTAADGPILIGWSYARARSVEDDARLAEMKELVKGETAKLHNVFPVAVYLNRAGETMRVLVEMEGPRSVTPEEVELIQTAASEAVGEPIELSIWHRSDAVVTTNGHSTFDEFTKTTLQERIQLLPHIFDKTRAEEDTD